MWVGGSRLATAALLLLLLLWPVAAAEEPAPLEAELDYQLAARIDGSVRAPVGGILGSMAGSAGPPNVGAFRLEAAAAEAQFVRTTEGGLPDPTPLLPAPVSNLGMGKGSTSETRNYTQPLLTLVEIGALWNVVAFHNPNLGQEVSFAFPDATYGLGNAEKSETLVAADVPQPPSLAQALEAAQAGAAGRLKLTGDHVQAEVHGDFYLLLYGGVFQVETPSLTERIVTGRYEEPTPAGPASLPINQVVNQTVLLRVFDGVLVWENRGEGLNMYAPRFQVAGRLQFDRATGTLAWPDSTTQARADAVLLEGDLIVEPRGAAYLDEAGAPFGPVAIRGLAYAPRSGGPGVGALALAFALGAAAAATAMGAVRWIPGAGGWFFGLVAGFSMVGREDALRQASRSHVYEHVRQNPGVTLSAAQRTLGLGWGTTRYHVAVLERVGLLVTKRAGAKRFLFVNGAARRIQAEAWSALQNPSVRQLLDTGLDLAAGVSQPDVARRLDCTPQYAGRILRRLEEVGLLERRSEGRRGVYRATALLRDLEPRRAAARPAADVSDPPAEGALGPVAEPVAVPVPAST